MRLPGRIFIEVQSMVKGFRLGDFELIWLNGGRFELDGGAMFGVVPKVLWQKKYAVNAENYISLTAWPILVKTPQALVLIETGLGNKLTEKQKRIFRVCEEWAVVNELNALGIDREDIDFVVLTHFDFDHAGGAVMLDDSGKQRLTFPKAKYILQKKEWADVMNPNIRNINTYWPVNNELLRESELLELVEGDLEVVPGIKVVQTGGHNRGHQIVTMESAGEKALHLADLLPTHAHVNPLWVMAYDNFPMDSIAMKEKWIRAGVGDGVWFTFYHDATLLACRFEESGNLRESWIA